MRNMRKPSRLIPARSERGGHGALLCCCLGAAALLAVAGYVLFTATVTVRGVSLFLVIAVCIVSALGYRREKRRLDALAGARAGDSICTFARSFDARHTDTWIIRSAYQEIQALLRSTIADFPLRASDSLQRDLHLDPDDIEDLLVDVATRSRRSLAGAHNNPRYGQVDTVLDLVLFLNAQARLPEPPV